MCDVCAKLGGSNYSAKLGAYMADDANKLANSREGLLFSQADFPYLESLLYLEPRVALPKPTRYYQNMFVDEKQLRVDWSSGAMRSIGFKGDKVVLLTKSAVKEIGKPERFNYYFLAELNREELNVAAGNNELRISFDGDIEGTGIKSGRMERHRLRFEFVHQHNEKAIIPKSRIASSSMYAASAVRRGRRILSRFEEYAITVMHFAPHPLLIQSYREFGFESRIEMQRMVYEMLKSHLM